MRIIVAWLRVSISRDRDRDSGDRDSGDRDRDRDRDKDGAGYGRGLKRHASSISSCDTWCLWGGAVVVRSAG